MPTEDDEIYRRSLDNLRSQLAGILNRLDVAGVESSGLLPDFVAEGLGRSAAGIAGVITFIDKALPPRSSVDEGNTDDAG